MDESLIEKLKRVIELHNQDTDEKVNNVSVRWIAKIGGKGSIEKIEVTI